MPNNKKKKGGNKKAAARSNAANKEDLAGLDDILRCSLCVPFYPTKRPTMIVVALYCTALTILVTPYVLAAPKPSHRKTQLNFNGEFHWTLRSTGSRNIAPFGVEMH